MANFYNLAKHMYNNRPYPKIINRRFPLKIKKNGNEFKVSFYIHIVLESSFCEFTIESSELDNKQGSWLTLFKTINFDNLEKFVQKVSLLK